MAQYTFVAFDPKGKEARGQVEGATQTEALERIKSMGYFPTRLFENSPVPTPMMQRGVRKAGGTPALPWYRRLNELSIPGTGGRVKPKALGVFTRQLATLIEAGLPLLRGLRLLEEQESNRTLKRIIGELGMAIEGGATFSEALAQRPKVFNRLYVNMVKAGELGGMLEEVLKRLAEFMEKAQKIKGKVIAAMFYPSAVMFVACGVLTLLMAYVVPKFKEIFDGLMDGKPLPAFTLLVLSISESVKNHLGLIGIGIVGLILAYKGWTATRLGRRVVDRAQLNAPIFGAVIRKVAVSRFSRTFGTLMGSGVPVLQALAIVKETSGNMIVANAVASVHESVKEGESIAAPLKASRVFPAMVIGMVDVGEQTGALPEMLMKVADTYDDEVDNAVTAMTSLIEPIMIVLLAIIVGSIVIALFMPLVTIGLGIDDPNKKGE
jgi:type IV pilus assembly protein PilC